jgi:hypothetical protein
MIKHDARVEAGKQILIDHPSNNACAALRVRSNPLQLQIPDLLVRLAQLLRERGVLLAHRTNSAGTDVNQV